MTGYVANYLAMGSVVRNAAGQIVRQGLLDIAHVGDGTSNTMLFTERITVCMKNPQLHRIGYTGDFYNIAPYANTDWWQWIPVVNYWPDPNANYVLTGAPPSSRRIRPGTFDGYVRLPAGVVAALLGHSRRHGRRQRSARQCQCVRRDLVGGLHPQRRRGARQRLVRVNWRME